jgi:hypothetical protein
MRSNAALASTLRFAFSITRVWPWLSYVAKLYSISSSAYYILAAVEEFRIVDSLLVLVCCLRIRTLKILNISV